jgi:hypothetical protein
MECFYNKGWNVANAEFEMNTENSTRSSHRESIIEHLFIGEMLKELWKEHATQVEVLKSQVDDAGYDIVIECKRSLKSGTSIPCYIQLKSAFVGSKTAKVSLSKKLTSKPHWCVIWIFFDENTLSLGPYLWFGTATGQTSSDITKFKPTKQTRGNKADRPGHCDVPKGKFVKLASIKNVIDKLFPNS